MAIQQDGRSFATLAFDGAVDELLAISILRFLSRCQVYEGSQFAFNAYVG